jgi:hypothetical protein
MLFRITGKLHTNLRVKIVNGHYYAPEKKTTFLQGLVKVTQAQQKLFLINMKSTLEHYFKKIQFITFVKLKY